MSSEAGFNIPKEFATDMRDKLWNGNYQNIETY